MHRITVDPDHLQMLSSDFRRAAGDIRTLHERLGTHVGSVDAAFVRKSGIGEQWDKAGNMMQRLAEQAEAQAGRLKLKAQEFEQADYDAAGGLARTFDSF